MRPTQSVTTPRESFGSVHGWTSVHAWSRALVVLTFAISSIVFFEPAPFDAMALGLIVLLPVVGLVAITPVLVGLLATALVIAAASFVGASLAPTVHMTESVTHAAVSTYLYVFAFVIAAFVAKNPARHVDLIMNGWIIAAIIASTAGIIGYFELIPDAHALFTKFDRASGPFKDPNVFGPFLIPPFLYALNRAIHAEARTAITALLMSALFAFAIFLSFSRGAWINMALSATLFAYLSFVTAARQREQRRLLALLGAALVVGCAGIGLALQEDGTADMLAQRAQLNQSYDTGSEGRFGGQAKAVDVIASNPLGIGAATFREVYHHEEPHNVYLSMMMSGGWIGGLVYLALILTSLIVGARHALRDTPTRPIFLVIYCGFLATVLQGLIIDSDHWRHVYVLLALLWGLIATAGRSQSRGRRIISDQRPQLLRRLIEVSAPRRQPRIIGPALSRVLLPRDLVRAAQHYVPRRPARLVLVHH